MPRDAPHLRVVDAENCSGAASLFWIPGAANSIKRFCLEHGNIESREIESILALGTNSSCEVLRVFPPVDPRLDFTDVLPLVPLFTKLVHLGLVMSSLSQLEALRSLQHLTRLVVRAPASSPVFGLFQVFGAVEPNVDSAVALSISRMRSLLPPRVALWNFLLRDNQKFEKNLLMCACYLDRLSFAKALLQAVPEWDVNVACFYSNRTALLYALHCKSFWSPTSVQLEMLRFLFSYGASPFFFDRISGRAPLHFAFEKRMPNLLDMVMDAAVQQDPTSPAWIMDSSSDPLCNSYSGLFAVYARFPEQFQKFGLSRLREEIYRGRITKLFPNSPSRFREGKSSFRAPTWRCFAASLEEIELLRELLQLVPDDSAIDVDARDSRGCSFLHAYHPPQVLNVLLQTSKLSLNDADAKGQTAIETAILSGQMAMLDFFISRGGDVAAAIRNVLNTPSLVPRDKVNLCVLVSFPLSGLQSRSHRGFFAPALRSSGVIYHLIQHPEYTKGGPMELIDALIEAELAVGFDLESNLPTIFKAKSRLCKRLGLEFHPLFELMLSRRAYDNVIVALKADRMMKLQSLDVVLPLEKFRSLVEPLDSVEELEGRISFLELLALKMEAPTAIRLFLVHRPSLFSHFSRSHGKTSFELLSLFRARKRVSNIVFDEIVSHAHRVAPGHPLLVPIQKK